MWKGTVDLCRHSRGVFIKKKKVFKCIHPNLQVAHWMDRILSHNTHKRRNSLTQLFLTIWKAKSMFSSLFSVCCIPLPHCDCYLTCCPLRDPEGKREGSSCVSIWEEWDDESLSYVLTCLYLLERNQQHLVCKTTSEDREYLLCSARKEQIHLRDRIWGWAGS